MKKTAALLVAILSALLLGGAGYCLLTPDGSWRLARKAAVSYLAAEDVSAASVSGNLLTGLVLKQVSVVSPKKFGAVRQLRADACTARFFFGPKPALFHLSAEGLVLRLTGFEAEVKAKNAAVRGGSFSVEGISIEAPSWFEEMTVRSVEGNADSLRLKDIQAKGLRALTRGHVLDIQGLEIARPFGLKGIRNIENGRLSFDSSDTILFYGTQVQDELDFHVYSKYVHARDVLDLHYKKELLKRISGELEEMDIAARGPVEGPEISGKLRIDSLAYRRFLLSGCDITAFRLDVAAQGGKYECRGEVLLGGGRLRKKDTVLHLEPGRILFTGDPENPSFELEARSRVADTDIKVSLRGSMDRPDFKLSSDPPAPEGKLLVMLATGKAWKGSEKALSEQRLSAEAFGEFVDYFVLGGSGEKLASRFGIKDISLDYSEETKGIGVTKGLSEKTDLTYGFEVSGDPAKTPASANKLGIDYKVAPDTVVSVEGKRGKRPEAVTADGKAGAADSSLIMKARKQF